MSVWRYTAIQINADAGAKQQQRGELAGATAAEVRGSLRRLGLVPIELKQVPSRRTKYSSRPDKPASRILEAVRLSLQGRADRSFRGRRQPVLADFYDSLATMLDSGLPLLSAVETLLQSHQRAARVMLLQMREDLRGGASLSSSMRSRGQGWFDPVEVAMVEAAQHAGDLPGVLRDLAARYERSDVLRQKLIGALAYPALVSIIGIGVTIFLSTRTLPQLAQILHENKLEVPALTQHVMSIGQLIAGWWPLVLMVIAGASIIAPFLARLLAARMSADTAKRRRATTWLIYAIYPPLRRRIAVASFCLGLAQLLRSGVPVLEALRVLRPSLRHELLRARVQHAADAVERGEDLAGPGALADGFWFDAEFRQLVEIGQHSGELASTLVRLGERYERQATRLIDRAARLLEPLVIVALAGLIGVVVMAAVLPLIRLQEML